MSGQKPETSDSSPRRNMHRGGSRRHAGADVHRTPKPDPRTRLPGDAARTDVLGSVSSAQARWPEYNRVIIAISIGGASAIVAAAIVRAVTG